jgi:hypothetical protein
MVDEEVKSELESRLNKKIKRGSPVVWFDPYQQFVDYVDEIDLDGELMKLEDSALKLRHDLESQDHNFEENWIIYVPRKKEDADWLREYWLIGLIYKEAAEDVLTDIGYTVTHKERKRLREKDGNEIVNKPYAALESKDSNNPEKTDQFRIKKALELDEFTPRDATIKFIKDTESTIESLEDSNLTEDFVRTLSNHYGLSKDVDISDFKEDLVDALFLGELAEKSELDLSSYSNILPEEQDWSKCSQMIQAWQENFRYQEVFKQSEKGFRRRYPGIEDLISKYIDAEVIWNVKGIKAIDEILIRKTDELLAENKYKEASKILDKRDGIFWSLKHTNTHAPDWHYLEISNKLITRLEELKIESELQSIIDEYTDSMYEIDRLYRKTSEIIDDVELVRETPSSIRYSYKNYLRDLNDEFSDKFSPKDVEMDEQVGILDSVEEGSVVFILDALRYELAYDFDKINEVKPLIGVLPSKTNVGMASMLPDMDELSIEGSEDGLGVEINDSSIDSKSDRISYLEERGWHVYSNLEKLSTNDIEEIAEKAKDGAKVLIYSQSIDLLGENLENISLSHFNDVVGKTQRKADKLLRKGVEQIVVTTDHGFLYKPDESESEPVDKPEGNLLKCGPRYAFGTNLDAGNNIPIDITEYNIKTDLDFVFPKSLGIFSTPGRGRRFLHGGISVQELITPYAVLSDDSRTSGQLKVSISNAPDEVGSPQFQIELEGTQSKLGKKVVRIEATQYDNKITKDDTYCSIRSGTSTAIINLDTSSIENQTGKIKLTVFNDETNVRLDSKDIDINLLYGGDGL